MAQHARTEFPPYGALARAYQDSITSAPLPPPAWNQGSDVDSRDQTWRAWRERVLAVINAVLWPQWNEEAHQWVSPDLNRMTALTEADFSILTILNEENRLLDTRPTPRNAATAIPTHRQFFVDEDGTRPIGERYITYDVTLPAEHVSSMPSTMLIALKDKAGSTSLQFKSRLQRPRAYQIAKMMGRTHYWELAATSMSPSMSSGHSLQGCLMVGGVYEHWMESGFSPSPEQRASLQQFAVDIGDRRVFAGVHYPSDNLASWIIASNLAPYVYPSSDVAEFLWEAIVHYSIVFRHIEGSGTEIYKPAVQEILNLKPD